jgi:hypothetical protein
VKIIYRELPDKILLNLAAMFEHCPLTSVEIGRFFCT